MSNFVEGSVLGVPDDVPGFQPNTVFVNTHTGAGMVQFPPAKWFPVDVSALVPAGTKAVFLLTMGIITNAGQSNMMLTLAYRKVGSPHNVNCYVDQPLCSPAGQGTRQTTGTWVPLVNGKYDMQWTMTPACAQGESSAYGINQRINGYLR